MNDNLIATLLSAFGVIAASAITIFLSRAKDREAVWRATKLKYYEEFMVSLSGTVSADVEIADKKRWAFACNNLQLVASNEVIKALRDFQNATGTRSVDISADEHDAILSRLIWNIRVDLGIKPRSEAPDFAVRMWSAPKK